MLFFLCALLTLWFFIWVSKAVECMTTAQRQTRALEEIAYNVQEIAHKLSQIANK